MTRLEFIPAGPQHARLWHQWRKDADALKFNPMSEMPIDLLEDRLHQCSGDLSNETYHEYRWMLDDGNALIGTVSLHQVSWPHLHADVGYQIDAAHQGRGLGTLAVRLLVQKAFQESRLHRLIALIHSENTASIKIVQKLGFQHEGTMRSHFQINGQFVDEDVYGLLRSEWQHPLASD